MQLTWPTALNALTNQNLFVAVCNSMLRHPTRGTTRCRSCGRIFAAVKKHSSASFKATLAPLGAQKIKKLGAGALQKFRCLRVAKLEVRERLLITEGHHCERQSCRDRLD